jgi:hypothetical protein
MFKYEQTDSIGKEKEPRQSLNKSSGNNKCAFASHVDEKPAVQYSTLNPHPWQYLIAVIKNGVNIGIVS